MVWATYAARELWSFLLEDKFPYNTAIVLTDEQKVNKTEQEAKLSLG